MKIQEEQSNEWNIFFPLHTQ